MTTYFSTFASGLSEIVRDALGQQLNDLKIELVLDGLIVYQSDRPLQQIKQIRFINNTFFLIHLFSGLQPPSPASMMNVVMKKPELVNVPGWIVKGYSFFRITASKENQTVPINRDLLTRMEKFFAHKLRMRENRSRPDTEVWFLERSEGLGLVGLRLTHNPPTEKNLKRGELKPELTNILCLLSEPGKKDVFLDPFAGSGAIPIERARYFPYKEITASDNDKETVHQLRLRTAKLGKKINIQQWNALHLDQLGDSTIDKIVTDPPWGFFISRTPDQLEQFLLEMLCELRRVLKEGGIAVVLMGQKESFEISLKNCLGLTLLNKYDILVSGKKAGIFKLQKA